jgi:hypothetical protein
MFGKKLSEDELDGMRQAYDAVFAKACLECADALSADREMQRLAADVLSCTSLLDQADAYTRLDDNVDRKLRAILSAREKGQSFDVGAIQVGSHVCKRRGRVLITAKVTGKARRCSRQSIEVTIKGAK